MEEYEKKFTTNLLDVIETAKKVSQIYDSSYIGSEHIVLAMLNTPACTAY